MVSRPCPTPPHPTPPHLPALPCPSLSCPVLHCLALPCPALSNSALPCLALLFPVPPYLAVLCTTLPCPIHPTFVPSYLLCCSCLVFSCPCLEFPCSACSAPGPGCQYIVLSRSSLSSSVYAVIRLASALCPAIVSGAPQTRQNQTSKSLYYHCMPQPLKCTIGVPTIYFQCNQTMTASL